MTPKRYQISTTISAATWYQIVRLTVDYGTKREVITRAVELLEKQQERNQVIRGELAAAHDYTERLVIAIKNARRRTAVLVGLAICHVRLVHADHTNEQVPRFMDIYAGAAHHGKSTVAAVILEQLDIPPNNPEVLQDGTERPLSYMTADLAPELYDIH